MTRFAPGILYVMPVGPSTCRSRLVIVLIILSIVAVVPQMDMRIRQNQMGLAKQEEVFVLPGEWTTLMPNACQPSVPPPSSSSCLLILPECPRSLVWNLH